LCGKNRLSWDLNVADYKDHNTTTINWVCSACGKKIEFDQLSDITKDFFNNFYLAELNIIFNEKFKPHILNKGGNKLDIGVSQFHISGDINNQSYDIKCGNCQAKNNFKAWSDEESSLYQCMKCGRINQIDEKKKE